MEDRILEQLYPDDYGSRKYRLLEREVRSVTSNNCVVLAERAKREYEFLHRHRHKSGFYLADWRVIYSTLYRFLATADLEGITPNEKEVLQRFSEHYEESSDELYDRLEKSDA